MNSEFDMHIDWYDVGDDYDTCDTCDTCDASAETDYDNYCFIDEDDHKTINPITAISQIISKDEFDTYNDFYITHETVHIIKKYNSCIQYSMIVCTIISTSLMYFQFWLLHQ